MDAQHEALQRHFWKGTKPGEYCTITSAGQRQGALCVARVETNSECFIHVRVRGGRTNSPLECVNVPLDEIEGPREPPRKQYHLARQVEQCQICASSQPPQY